ncbi:transporter substrate-binding domain-containing protein [Paraburkholderia lycopersici]|uniref:Polar amino acid transport system substrate-binding protein n=1 Tax=Paraburkholderia lycopersici TaxID=416944 RepID=A0A1G6P9Z0_9BURK|nr:transporter substrate-binding domain-containing protein [Paraburkholderia lycopersici]SDC76818.1 polar amino acid transport system substrate-binding protein [Paraburkholderia lycopersici]
MKTLNRREFLGCSAALLASAACSVTATAYAQSGSTLDAIRKSQVLKIGAVADGEPNFHKDHTTGEWSGIYIDFAKRLASSMNVQLRLYETTWGNAILDLQSAKIDLFLGLNPTPQRMAVIDFTDPLYDNAYSLIANKSFTGRTWGDLNQSGVTIAVDVGSSYDNLVTSLCPKAKILRFETSNAATLAVQTRRADVQPLVITLAAGTIKKNPDIGKLVIPQPVKLTSSCAGVRKEPDKAWLNYLNAWLKTMHQSDTVKNIVFSNMDRLMGVKPAEIPAVVQF